MLLFYDLNNRKRYIVFNENHEVCNLFLVTISPFSKNKS